MGLYCLPRPKNGVLVVLLIKAIVLVALMKKNMLRFLLELVAGAIDSEEDSIFNETTLDNSTKARRVSVTRYASLRRNRCKCDIARTSSSTAVNNGGPCACSGSNSRRHFWPSMQCCVCLCRFEAHEDEEVSELSCKHFFHKICLEKWFDNQRSTCPFWHSVL